MPTKTYTWNASTTENITFNAVDGIYTFTVAPTEGYEVKNISFVGSENVIKTDVNQNVVQFTIPTGDYIESITVQTEEIKTAVTENLTFNGDDGVTSLFLEGTSLLWIKGITRSVTFDKINYVFSVSLDSRYRIKTVEYEGSNGVTFTREGNLLKFSIPIGDYISSITITSEKIPLTAVFFQSRSESHRVDKTSYLITISEQPITILQPSSILNPTLIIEYDRVPNFNYCWIELFSRYYYINEIISVRNNVWELHLTVDVLMSFKDRIKTQKANIIRQEFIGNSMMVDSNIPVLGQPRILINSMGSPIFSGEYNTPLSDGNEICFVLITQGKRIEV